MDTALFGEPVESSDWTEHRLAEQDAATFTGRHCRLCQTIEIVPDGAFMMPMEAHAVFTEERDLHA